MRCGGGCPRVSFGDRHTLLALHERGETCALLAPRHEPPGIVAGVAADVVRGNLDVAFADERGPQQIDGKPSQTKFRPSSAAARSIARQISAEGGPAC